MEVLQNWLDATNIPLLSAFILGIMTAISPCPLATNITAIGFISKDIENKKRIFLNGLWYTLGRAITYSVIGIVIYILVHSFVAPSASDVNSVVKKASYDVAKPLINYGEKFLGPLLIIIGILMFDFIRIKLPGFGKLTDRIQNRDKKSNWWRAMLLGILFALAFCPYSGVLYFGALMPMTIISPSGLLLPVVFAVATGLPVIIVAYLLAFSISSVGGFYNKVKIFEKWFRRVVAVAFIIVGSYYVYLFYIKG